MVNKAFDMNTRRHEKQAEEALLRCLREVPALQVRRLGQRSLSPRPDVTPDIVIKVESANGQALVIGEYKTIGEPRIARQAVDALFRITSAVPNSYGVFLAPYVSPSAAQICREMGTGYIDLAGNCLLVFDKVYISREGRPNPFSEKRGLKSLFSPKAERLLRVLLVNPGKSWKTRPLAREAQVSLGETSNVRKRLLDREWLVETSDGVMLSDPDSLIGEWSRNYGFRKNTASDFYSMMATDEIEEAIANVCDRQGTRYGLTGFSAAARFAPSTRYQRVMAYVDAAAEDIAQELGLKEVDSGANISILEPYDEGVYYGGETRDGIQIVSPVQAYLDLNSYRGRGEEAADFLLKTRIRPTWQDTVNTREQQ